MSNEKSYVSQVELLLQCLPAVASETCFALKGGTAINLFMRDLPRLSVDLDLVYLPMTNRDQTLAGIDAGLLRIRDKILDQYPTLKIITQINQATRSVVKLNVINQETSIVIEPNLILRGLVYPEQKMAIAPAVEKRFKTFIENVPIASVNDVYAGKICAALDRQHPRDLFDVKLLLEEGIKLETKKAFLVYLASNNRPMAELLNPNLLEQREEYQKEFVGMINVEVSYEALIEARAMLIATIRKMLTTADKEFLLSIKQGYPRWDRVGLPPHVSELPGIKWKLLNISRMEKAKHLMAIRKLEEALS